MTEAMVGRTYDVVTVRDGDGWFVGSVPGLPGCPSRRKAEKGLLGHMREAIELSL